jgi:hypothetical protein
MTTRSTARILRRSALGVVLVAGLLAGCGPAPAPPAVGTVAIMGSARVSAAQLARWFSAAAPPGYRATVDPGTLASIFVSEGAAEGVRGDVAFLQSIVETGWFRFTGSVAPTSNNFAGIGATDSGGTPASFPDARTGVRAQIQHLRAYADPTATSCTVPPLHFGCVDPRFNLVSPKGKAPTWNQMGNGNWATSSTYATTILNLYAQLLQYHGLTP